MATSIEEIQKQALLDRISGLAGKYWSLRNEITSLVTQLTQIRNQGLLNTTMTQAFYRIFTVLINNHYLDTDHEHNNGAYFLNIAAFSPSIAIKEDEIFEITKIHGQQSGEEIVATQFNAVINK